MASLRGPFCHWRKNGDRYKPHPYVVYVYITSNTWITHRYLHDPCFLDEYETLYFICTKKSVEIPVGKECCMLYVEC